MRERGQEWGKIDGGGFFGYFVREEIGLVILIGGRVRVI